MPVIYGGYSIRPAPQVSLNKVFSLTGDGRVVGTTINARLTGTITPEVTPDPESGVVEFTSIPIQGKLSSILSGMTTLRDAFSQSGLMFEVQGWDGSAPTKFNATIDSIDFAEGLWTDVVNYTISLHGDTIAGEDTATDNCESASESWTFEEGDLPRTWKGNHTASAKGKLVYAADGSLPLLPWQYAQAFVNSRLGIDWTTTTSWSPGSGSSLAAASAVEVPSNNQWDRHVVETVDEEDGTYSVTETWTLNANPYVEQYAIGVRRVDEPGVTTVASVNGTITGLRKTMGINDDKYNAALAAWETVQDLLSGRCQEASVAIDGGTLNTHPISVSVSHDRYAGTISYEYEFNDKVYVNDAYETYAVTPSVGLEDYRTTVRIDGTITGAVYFDDDPSTTIKYTRASLQWGIVKPLLLARAIAESGVDGLQPFPSQAQVVQNPLDGTIQYSYEFNDRNPSNVTHAYSVGRKTSREDGTTRVTIDGTITGLRTDNASEPFGTGDVAERYDQALGYYNGISGNLLGMASQYVSLSCINPTPWTTSVSYAPLAGTVSYTAEFNSTIAPLTPGALSEVVSVQDEYAVEQVAVVPVLGRSRGPVIQDLGTVNENRRTVTAEIVMLPPTYGCNPIVFPPTFDVSPYIPANTNVLYKTQDSQVWTERTGRYTRTVVWIYE